MDYLIPEPTRPIRKDSSLSQSVEYEEFMRENHDFFLYGPSQNSILMLDALINSKSIPMDYSKHQVRLLLIQILNEIALSEVEVTFWTILIEKYSWTDNNIEIRLLLTFTGLLTKMTFDSNIDYLLNKYSQKEDFFKENFFTWCTNKNVSQITIAQINQQYQKLQREKKNRVNYNFYVDEIILQYLPYKSMNKKSVVTEPILPAFSTINCEINEEMPTIGSFSDNIMLPPLPLIKNSSNNSLYHVTNLENQGSGCSQFLCFDV